MDARTASPPGQCDVVVIGAGMGGLTAAALLSRAGLNVQVLEMDARPGGYLAGFRRKDFRFDSAIHWLNQLGPKGIVTRVFEAIGKDHPRAAPQTLIKRYKGRSFDYLLTNRPDELKAQLIRDFPSDRPGIERFFRDAERLGEAFDGMGSFFRTEESMPRWERAMHMMKKLRFALPFIPHLRFSGTTGIDKGLRKYFSDARLRTVFASEMDILSCLVPVAWAYYGDYQMPPVGGSQVIPEWLCHVVERLGNSVHYHCRVTEVLVENGAAVGVRLAQRGVQREIRCKAVVAACDVEALYERMLPTAAVPEKLKAKLREAELYPSSITVSLGLDKPPQELGFGEEMIFLCDETVPRERQCSGLPDESGISILAPSLRDPSLAPAGMGTLTLYIPADFNLHTRWRTVEGAERGDAYEALKKDYADRLIARVEKSIAPGLSQHVVWCDVATPITHWRYTGNRNGSIMGARPGKKNFQLGIAHYRTPVKRLYLGGHWAELGGGVPIATRAGANAALLVLYDMAHPAARPLARYMDGRLTSADLDKSGRFRSYPGDWVRDATPAEKKAARAGA